jgi:hypothetical protein
MRFLNHDTGAIDDEKLAELIMNYGYEGYGLFWAILEKIARQEQPVKTVVLKKQLKVGRKLEKCWEFMESIGLIHSNNGETFNEQLLNYAGKYAIKKEKTAKRVSEWRERQGLTETVTRYKSVRNAPVTPVNRIEENRIEVNKRKEAPADAVEDPLQDELQKREAQIAELREQLSAEQKKSSAKRKKDEEPLRMILMPFDSELFADAWERWKNYKQKQFRFNYKSAESEQAALVELSEVSGGVEETALKIIQKSIANGWQGLFKLKDDNGKQSASTNYNNGGELNADLKRQLAERMAAAANRSPLNGD